MVNKSVHFFILMFMASVSLLSAGEIKVSSIPDLQSAVDTAAPGDTIILADGTYLNSNFNISTSAVTVKAATPGGVRLNGGTNIAIYGDYVTFSGFQFTSGDIGTGYLIIVYGSHNKLTQLNFNGYSAKKYIVMAASTQYTEVSYCNFQNKPASAAQGNLIHIDPDAATPGYNKIRYCSFQKMPGAGGDNGNECIRISNGATSTYVSRTIVEYCYFEDTGLGDSEVISVKCKENVLRYNTMNNNLHGNFCFRNGDNNIAYGNFFINSGGIRFKVANNVYCYNNYFQNCGDGSVSAPFKYVYDNGAGIPHLNNINVIHNTIVDGTAIELDSHAAGNTWANNIIKKSSGNIFSGNAAISWAGNISQGTTGITIASGMTNADPKLVLNADGYYQPSSTSPAIDASSASYPAVLDIANVDDDPFIRLDISGRTRSAAAVLKDVGCSEYLAAGASVNRPLKLTDVGPSYLGGPSTGINHQPSDKTESAEATGFALFAAYPNPFNPTTHLSFQIREACYVSLKIFDLSGKETATIVDGYRPAGQYQMEWNAADRPSGAYYCRLQADNAGETKKLLLIK